MSNQSFNADPVWESTSIPNTPYNLYPAPCSTQATSETFETSKDPRLILLCSWTDASPKHIMKYIHYYRTMYRTSPILVAHTSSADFFLVSRRALRRKLEPAIEIIRAHLEFESDGRSNEGFLAHALSNGGSGHLTCLARQFYADTGRPLPVHALVLDSTPTRAPFPSLVASMNLTLPSSPWIRLPMKALIMMLLFLAYVLPRWMGKSNMADRVFDDLNSLGTVDKSGRKANEWLRKEAIRSYIYSDADEICLAKDIKPHAMEAARRGLRVRNEVWIGSGHVTHMKLDPQRYWNVVKETWEDRS